MFRPETDVEELRLRNGPVLYKQEEGANDYTAQKGDNLSLSYLPGRDAHVWHVFVLFLMNSDRSKISVVLITFNEAENLRRTLPPLLEVSDDIVVIDSGSTDDTVALCESYGARVIPRAWEGYASAKNFGNGQARHEWILSIDADEELSPELVRSLRDLVPVEGMVYALDRLTNFCGTWIRHSGWYPDWKVRLFNRSRVRWTGDFVHEHLEYPDGFSVQRLEGKLLHWSYTTTDDHLRRMQRYAELSARKMHARGKAVSSIRRLLGPPFRFLRTYFLKAGILDGRYGWLISVRNARMVRLKYQYHADLVRAEKKR